MTSEGGNDRERVDMNQTTSAILSFVPFLILSSMLGVVAFLLAREKGRNVPLWTILGIIPFINFACVCFFIGAANLRLERKLDLLLNEHGK